MKKICNKCNNEFTTRSGNYDKHINSCNGIYIRFEKSIKCKYCSLDFSDLKTSERANHSRWCDNNPKRKQYNKHLEKARNEITQESRRKAAERIKQAHAEGKYAGVAKKVIDIRRKRGSLFHSNETKDLIRQKALSSPHRRLKRKMIEYNGVWLDSTWELELAKRLDSLGIKWIRPDPLPWFDECGVKHNYFPDFYLIDYDIFLDPKNAHAKKVQLKKIDCLRVQYQNIVIINTLEECKTYFPHNKEKC
jgi:hypothetical protein